MFCKKEMQYINKQANFFDDSFSIDFFQNGTSLQDSF